MSGNVLALAAVAVIVALVIAYAWMETRPQRTWSGQLIDDLGGLGGIVGAFA